MERRVTAIPLRNAEGDRPLILPELVSGRGTSRRSRMVEGQACRGFVNYPSKHRVRIVQNVARCDAQRPDPDRFEPSISCPVTDRLIASRVSYAIDFDGQPRVSAKEINDVRTARMLTAKLEATRSLTQPTPENYFRKTHLSPKLACFDRRAGASFRRDVFEHPLFPSTVLRTVPLPETSSGRI